MLKYCSKKCEKFIEQQYTNNALKSLEDFVRIDNMSKAFYTDEQQWKSVGWQKLEKAAEHIKQWIEKQNIKGCKTEIIAYKEQNLTPIIFTQVEGQINETVFFYGHYDKQPPFVGWNEENGFKPYEPVYWPKENPEKLFGRGGADDGYSTYSSMLAIKALQEQGVPLPRCVMITEGDEESCSGDIEKHINKLKERIGSPYLVFSLDSGCVDYDRLYVTTALRGGLAGILRVEVLKEGAHSGSASGIVPSSFRILRALLERIENGQTGYMIPEFDADIPPNRYKELYDLAQEKGKDAIRPFAFIDQMQPVASNPLQSLILNGWKAQLAIVGIDGLPLVKIAGNVMLPYTEVKISMRLPPNKNSKEARKVFEDKLTKNVPYNAKVQLSKLLAFDGFNAPQMSKSLTNSLQEASQTYFGKKVLSIAEGGSIPFMNFLNTHWPKAQFVVIGVLGPESNAHGPNEFLHIPYVKKLTCCISHILANAQS